MARAVILASERSGSTLLCDILDQCDGCQFHHELFHATEIQYKGRVIADAKSLGQRNADPIAFMNQVFATSEEQGYHTVGFKLFLYHNETVLRYLIADESYKLIFLDRANILAKYASARIAAMTGQWGALSADRIVNRQIVFDREDFERYEAASLDLRSKALRLLATAGREVFFVEFASIVHCQVQARVARFLGLNAVPDVRPNIQRQNPVSIADRFTNSESVRSYLASRKKAGWLDPG
jgi:LPS sulfotransferase NodH